MPDEEKSETSETEQDEKEKPALEFEPGELASFPLSPHPAAELSDNAKNVLKELCDLASKKDLAARRWEVNQAWEARLFDRGYQYLWPRKNGGWLIPPASTPNTSGQRAVSGFPSYGRETNIVGAYGEIITAALTRDVPTVRFQPANPESDPDITAAGSATKYAELFKRSNDLLQFQQDMIYYLRTDGRVTIVVDHILDAQRFGREDEREANPVAPETEQAAEQIYAAYLVRHGETELNEEGKLRGRSDVGLDHRGDREIHRTAEWLKTKGVRRLVSSPVPRAADSAQQIGQAIGLPVEMDERFASLDLGELAGQDRDATHEQIKDYFEKGDEAFPGGESPDAFRSRVSEGLMDILRRGEGPVAIVTHDSVIAQIFKTFQGESLPVAALLEPGGVAGIFMAEDGSVAIESVYPFRRPESAVSETRGKPRGQEIVSVYGKLESKVTINAKDINDMPVVQVSQEFDVSTLKARYPKFADEIMPGPSGAGELEMDRIARINIMIALEASYVTGDSLTLDATEQKTWMRPSWFMNAKDKEAREELLTSFPDGALVIYAGDCQVLARNEKMDDHVGVWNAFPGSGQNRMALCSKLMSVQRKLNNWMELLDLYFRNTVPAKHMNAEVYNVEALRSQPTIPGAIIPFTLAKVPPQHVKEDLVFIEPTPTHQPTMPEFIKFFVVELPQLLSHAMPSLFGAESNQDTAMGQAMQRDQALETMGTPWHAIQQATCRYFRQAVQLAARCRTNAVIGTTRTGEAVRIELSELAGNVLCFPEQDANFPESWNQRQTRYQMLILDAAANPFITKLLTTPANLKMARDMSGLFQLRIPEAESYEKQQGELEELLKTGPLPNPEKEEAEKVLKELKARMLGVKAQGSPILPEEQAALAQLEQKVASLADLISTVAVEDEDRDEFEYQAVLDFINSPEGRRMRNGNDDERAGFENARLHGREHKAKIPPPEPEMKPPSTSISFKDLATRAPAAAADLLKHQGLTSAVAPEPEQAQTT
jgi:broad specificity phosphatase PhoE